MASGSRPSVHREAFQRPGTSVAAVAPVAPVPGMGEAGNHSLPRKFRPAEEGHSPQTPHLVPAPDNRNSSRPGPETALPKRCTTVLVFSCCCEGEPRSDDNIVTIANRTLFVFQTCPMKGRPEQFFLDQFSERFMDHVRQVSFN